MDGIPDDLHPQHATHNPHGYGNNHGHDALANYAHYNPHGTPQQSPPSSSTTPVSHQHSQPPPPPPPPPQQQQQQPQQGVQGGMNEHVDDSSSAAAVAAQMEAAAAAAAAAMAHNPHQHHNPHHPQLPSAGSEPMMIERHDNDLDMHNDPNNNDHAIANDEEDEDVDEDEEDEDVEEDEDEEGSRYVLNNGHGPVIEDDDDDDEVMQGQEQEEPEEMPGASSFSNVAQGLEGKHRDNMLQYWQDTINSVEHDDHKFKIHQLPLARIKKVMKADEDVRMISAEAPILFAKGCDIFITELTMRAWIHAEENKRRTLQRSDIANALQKSDMFDFLIDIVPREEAVNSRRNEDVANQAADESSVQPPQQQQQPQPQQQPPTSEESSEMPQPEQNYQYGELDYHNYR